MTQREAVIPAMTDPMGRHWHQPSRDRIELDDKHARMTEATFKELSEYSATVPTGVYPGKMWRRHDGAFDRKRKTPPVWMLCWFGDVRDGQCEIHFREVELRGPQGEAALTERLPCTSKVVDVAPKGIATESPALPYDGDDPSRCCPDCGALYCVCSTNAADPPA